MLKKFIKNNIFLIISLVASVAMLIITPPTISLLKEIDWKTLGFLFMMLSVLSGFKKENIFNPIIKKSAIFKKMTTMSLFLVFCVFFSSMFVTNDVSLIVFVPLTIAIFQNANKAKYILPIITLENIAAIRGSLISPFGSPQNIFLYNKSNTTIGNFILHMLPLWLSSAILLVIFIFFIFRKDIKEKISIDVEKLGKLNEENKIKRRTYITLLLFVIVNVVTRTEYWYISLFIISLVIFITDKKVLFNVDYSLIATFLCFFIFSSCVTSNDNISNLLSKIIENNEYWCSIILSQFISNVPAGIILYPYSKNFAGLIYGLDTAGLVTIIGSLASLITLKLYTKQYLGEEIKFIKVFSKISLSFFAIVVLPGYLLSSWNFF